MSLNFLEANNIISVENELETKKFILAASGQVEKLDVFLKANCILNSFNCQYTTLPFNTLQQYISTASECEKEHVFLLFPWDVFPEADWRTGVTLGDFSFDEAQDRIDDLIKKINCFTSSHVFYIPARTLPVTFNYELSQQIEHQIILSLLKINATILAENYFSISSYLANGCAISSKKLSDVSSAIAGSLIVKRNSSSKKILFTDFDNVMWRGVIGEDGVDGIQCDAEGAGYTHFIYQSYLLKLKSQGILIAGITKNDDELASLPFRCEKTLFKASDFVTLSASYHAKSSQIKQILIDLNLDVDSAVFIDDNPIELEEVKNKLNDICCLAFPTKDEGFPDFIGQIQRYFNLANVTEDDKKRTELYKTRYKSSIINTEQGANLTEYLKSLQMQLTIKQCDATNFHRTLQLINKTNQFNLNGMRLTDTEIIELINKENTLFLFTLADKFGSHGQIACVILSENKDVEYFVMSCRVFQRQIEYAIIAWLIKHLKLPELKLNFQRTPKNIPFQMMIDNDLYTINSSSVLKLDTTSYMDKYKNILNLFEVDVDI